MPLEAKYPPLVVILAIAFISAISLLAYLVALVYRKLKIKEKEDSESELIDREIIISKTSGEQLDNLYKYTLYYLFLEIIAFLMFFPLFAISEETILIDIWPFILVGFVIIFALLSIVDWSKLRSKRTLQKDLRRY